MATKKPVIWSVPPLILMLLFAIFYLQKIKNVYFSVYLKNEKAPNH